MLHQVVILRPSFGPQIIGKIKPPPNLQPKIEELTSCQFEAAGWQDQQDWRESFSWISNQASGCAYSPTRPGDSDPSVRNCFIWFNRSLLTIARSVAVHQSVKTSNNSSNSPPAKVPAHTFPIFTIKIKGSSWIMFRGRLFTTKTKPN